MSELKNVKPKIEDVIREVLIAGAVDNALSFIAYLRKNKMSPQWSAANSWKVVYKAHNVCVINLIVWENVEYCTKCNACRGDRMTIFGKEFDNVCGRIHFINPDAKAIECIKQLIPMRKNAINEERAHKHK